MDYGHESGRAVRLVDVTWRYELFNDIEKGRPKNVSRMAFNSCATDAVQPSSPAHSHTSVKKKRKQTNVQMALSAIDQNRSRDAWWIQLLMDLSSYVSPQSILPGSTSSTSISRTNEPLNSANTNRSIQIDECLQRADKVAESNVTNNMDHKDVIESPMGCDQHEGGENHGTKGRKRQRRTEKEGPDTIALDTELQTDGELDIALELNSNAKEKPTSLLGTLFTHANFLPYNDTYIYVIFFFTTYSFLNFLNFPPLPSFSFLLCFAFLSFFLYTSTIFFNGFGLCSILKQFLSLKHTYIYIYIY